MLEFCLNRGKPCLRIEVRTDQVDAPIFKNFQKLARSLLDYGAKIQKVTGFDPNEKKVLEGTVETPATPPAQQLPIKITQLDFKSISSLDGLVLAADVLANSLAHHYQQRGRGERYRRLNKIDALEGHPLFGSLDLYLTPDAMDVSDVLYPHPCDPDVIQRLPFRKRVWAHIACAFRWLRVGIWGRL
jgi:hypothetical protein